MPHDQKCAQDDADTAIRKVVHLLSDASSHILAELETACTTELARRGDCHPQPHKRRCLEISASEGSAAMISPPALEEEGCKAVANDAGPAVDADGCGWAHQEEDEQSVWEADSVEGLIECLCKHNAWHHTYWCDSTAAETLRLCTLHRPRPVTATRSLNGLSMPFPSSKSCSTTIEVTGEDSLISAQRLITQGSSTIAERPLVLNMANQACCGGGFLRGAPGQEEELCRRSTLFCELADVWYDSSCYPIDVGTALYSPDVAVLRSPAPSYAALQDTFKISVITAAAERGPDLVSTEHAVEEYEQRMALRISALLRACYAVGHQKLVLSAWGCGAFRNPPASVAKIFADALKPGAPFHGAFEHVVFAVYDRPDWPDEFNKQHFESSFSELSRSQLCAHDQQQKDV